MLLSRLVVVSLLAVSATACGQEEGEGSQGDLVLDSATLVQELGLPADQAGRVARETNRYVSEIGGTDTYRAVFIQLGAEPNPQSIAETGAWLVMRGAVRLGDSAVDSVARIRSRWIERFGCERAVSSSTGTANRWQLLAQLDSTSLANLMDFYTETTLAVINQTGTVPEFDRERLVSAWRTFHTRLPLVEQDQFVRFLDNPAPSAEDECWFQRRLWSLLPELSTEDRRIILWQIATNQY